MGGTCSSARVAGRISAPRRTALQGGEFPANWQRQKPCGGKCVAGDGVEEGGLLGNVCMCARRASEREYREYRMQRMQRAGEWEIPSHVPFRTETTGFLVG